MSYAEARRLLVDGRFAEASGRFVELARSAPSSIDRELALELAALSATWDSRKVRLTEEADLEDSTVARATNRRTADEISVLYLNSAIYGIGSGAVIAVHTEPDAAAGVIMPALFLGGAGVGAVALLDSGRGLGYGVPQSIVSGMYLGLGQGIVWTIWNQARVNYYDEWEPTTIADLIWASATVGAVAGGALSTAFGATPGRASYVSSAALWSSVLFGLLGAAAGRDDRYLDDRALLASAIGLNAGAVTGVLTAGAVSPSIARVRFLDLGALAGGAIAGGLYLSASDRNVEPQGAMIITSFGIAGGLGTAWWLTRDMKQDRGPRERQSGAEPWVQLAVAPTPGGGRVTAVGGF